MSRLQGFGSRNRLYTGVKFERHPYSKQRYKLNTAEEMVLKMAETDFFPHLEWMSNLRSLSLVKLGEFSNTSHEWDRSVRSLLLEDLLEHIFFSL